LRCGRAKGKNRHDPFRLVVDDSDALLEAGGVPDPGLCEVE
jgi:hypothetical protein